MPYTPISSATVIFDTLAVNQRGFGTPLILDEHNYTLERIKFYDKDSYQTELPSYSKAYKAISAAFSVNPAPELVALGRRKCNATLLPDVPTVGDVFSVRISYGSTFTDITYTAPASPTVTSVGAAIAGLINGVPAVAAVLSANSVAGLITLTPVGTGVFKISAPVKLTVGNVATTENIAATMTAIQAESIDYTAIFETSRATQAITELSDWVAANQDYVMSYATSLSTTYSTDYSATSSDFPSVFKRAGRPHNVFPVYVQASELDKFPEVRIFANRARSQPGDVIYSNMTNLGIEPAKSSTGELLTKAELARLDARGLSYFEYVKGIVTLRRGRSQGAGDAAWADDTMIKIFTIARIDEALATRHFNTNTRKLGGRPGIIALVSVIESVMNNMTSVGTEVKAFQEGSVEVTIPTADEIRESRPGRLAKIKVSAKLESAWDSSETTITFSY